MKTLKFQNIRDMRQETHNPEDYSFIPFNFNGKDRRVYSNMNVSIMIDDYCNADCKFCVAQLRYENVGKLYSKPKLKHDDYIKQVDYLLNYLKPLNPSISITGGEPTKSSKLPEVLELINKYGYRKRTLTTNGSGLFDNMNGKTVIQHIVDNKFQHLNISKAHFDEDINRGIMSYRGGYTSNEMLETIVAFSKANNLSPRMSCLLLKEGISSLDDAIAYMDFYQNIGLENVIFRELMNYDAEAMKNDAKIKYCVDNKVYLDDIWKQIDNDERFTPIRNIDGYYYYVEVYKYKNISMCSESANLVKLYDEKTKHPDIVYEMVIHPNGSLNGSWVDTEDILVASPL